jgi:hypothetical protein
MKNVNWLWRRHLNRDMIASLDKATTRASHHHVGINSESKGGRVLPGLCKKTRGGIRRRATPASATQHLDAPAPAGDRSAFVLETSEEPSTPRVEVFEIARQLNRVCQRLQIPRIEAQETQKKPWQCDEHGTQTHRSAYRQRKVHTSSDGESRSCVNKE